MFYRYVNRHMHAPDMLPHEVGTECLIIVLKEVVQYAQGTGVRLMMGLN